MAKAIELKVWPEYFHAILSGRKKFEARLGNLDCGLGDTLILKEWDPEKKDYTGRKIEKRISFVFRTKNQKFWTEEEVEKQGLVVMSLEDV